MHQNNLLIQKDRLRKNGKAILIKFNKVCENNIYNVDNIVHPPKRNNCYKNTIDC